MIKKGFCIFSCKLRDILFALQFFKGGINVEKIVDEQRVYI
jgi:hypothetical protein